MTYTKDTQTFTHAIDPTIKEIDRRVRALARVCAQSSEDMARVFDRTVRTYQWCGKIRIPIPAGHANRDTRRANAMKAYRKVRDERRELARKAVRYRSRYGYLPLV